MRIALKIPNKKSTNITLKIHQIVVWLIGLTIVLVPTLFTQSVFISPIFSRTMLFWGLTTALIILYGILILLDKQFLPKFSSIGWLFLILVITLIISTIFSIQPFTSFWGSLDRMDGLMSWIYYLAFFTVMVGTIKSKTDWQLVIQIALWGILITTIYALNQFAATLGRYPWGQRLEGSLGNPVFLGGYYALVLPPLLAFCLNYRRASVIRTVANLTLALGYATLLFTFARGAWIATVLASLAVIIGFHFQRKLKITWGRWLGIPLVLLILVLGISWFNPTLAGVLKTRTVSTISLGYRTHIWSAALKSFADKPLVGWGLENFKIAYDKNFTIPKQIVNMPFNETRADRAHNEYLDMAVFGGILSLASYLLLMLSALLIGIKRSLTKNKDDSTHWLTIGFTGTIIAYLIYAITAFHLILNFLWLILALVWFNNLLAKPSKDSSKKLVYKVVTMAVMLVAMVTVYFSIITPVLAVNQANYGSISFVTNKVNESLTHFKKALGYKSFVSNIIRAQMAVLAINNTEVDTVKSTSNSFYSYVNQTSPDNFLTEPLGSHYHLILGLYNGKFAHLYPNLIEVADNHFQKYIELAPNRGEAYLWWAKMYITVDNKIEAETRIEQAIKIASDNEIVATFAGFFYLLNGEFDKGTQMFQKAITIVPNTTPEAMMKDLAGLLNQLGSTEEMETIKAYYAELYKAQLDHQPVV
jgi:O-antigen ligase